MSIDQENETLPILKAPAAREGEAIGLVPRD
jgi:hypothetical protein